MEPRPLYVIEPSLYGVMPFNAMRALYAEMRVRCPEKCELPWRIGFIETAIRPLAQWAVGGTFEENDYCIDMLRLDIFRAKYESDGYRTIVTPVAIDPSTGKYLETPWDWMHIRNVETGHAIQLPPREIKALQWLSSVARGLLICVFATKNVDRETRLIKGMWKRKNLLDKSRPTSVTTLRVPAVQYLPSEDGHATTDRTCRPHWRMPHWRKQHYGPKNALVKDIFIEGVFVKLADGEEISIEKTYKIVA